MNLAMPHELGERYVSRSQKARVVTEAWAVANLYCAACAASSIEPLPRNAQGADFRCNECNSHYQLKSASSPFRRRVVDSAYASMMAAIKSDVAPNLLLLHYEPTWFVSSLTLIPRFCFTAAAIQKRQPLGPSARRAGWVGCNILLDAIAPDARIPVVHNAQPALPHAVRDAYDRLRPLTSIAPELRGWTLDVLTLCRTLRKNEFSLMEAYSFESELSAQHPKNKNVRAKIRQQLQVLRDAGILEFVGAGQYRFKV